MYIVVELQKSGNQVANLVTSHETLNEAYSKYHTVLAAAAVSSIDAHSAILLNEYGSPIANQCYTHGTNAAE